MTRFIPALRLTAALLVMQTALSGSPALAFSVNDAADAYVRITDAELRETYTNALADNGESVTSRLFVFHLKGCSPSASERSVFIHAVQDRGLPRGGEYPTYVLVSGTPTNRPEITYKTYAGKRLYLANEIACQPDACLLSAQKGYSDVCLTDDFGNRASDLPGLRKDFWSDLLNLFGL